METSFLRLDWVHFYRLQRSSSLSSKQQSLSMAIDTSILPHSTETRNQLESHSRNVLPQERLRERTSILLLSFGKLKEKTWKALSDAVLQTWKWTIWICICCIGWLRRWSGMMKFQLKTLPPTRFGQSLRDLSTLALSRISESATAPFPCYLIYSHTQDTSQWQIK